MGENESAVAWGVRHGSCADALVWRESLGPDAGQPEAWRTCPRGDWLLWQWEKLLPSIRNRTRPAIQRALGRIVARAIRRGVQALRGVRSAEATEWRRWARRWLDGTDRTAAATAAALWLIDAAASAADAAATAWAAELRLQALDIRRELPEWPAEVAR